MHIKLREIQCEFFSKNETCTRLEFNFISFLRKIRNKYTLVYCTMPF